MTNNQTSNITLHQHIVILGVFFPLFRTVLMPAGLAFSAGVSGIFSLLLILLCELAVCLFFAIAKSPAPLFSSGTALSKIASGGLSVFLLLKLSLFLAEQKLMFSNVIFENTSGFFVMLPIFLLLFYCGLKRISTLAKTAQLFFPAVCFCFLAILLISLPAFSSSRLSPIDFQFQTVASGFYRFCFYGGDMLFYAIFCTENSSGERSPQILWGFAINASLSLLFYIVFFGVLGKTAPSLAYAIAVLSKYGAGFSAVGRFDFLLVSFCLVGIILLSGLLFSTAVFCLQKALPQKRKILSPLLAVMLLFAVLFASENFATAQKFAVMILPPIAILFQTVLPILWVLKSRRKHGK